MSVGTLEEIIDDNHAIVSTSVGSEHYVSILSFVDKDLLEPGCSVLLNHKVSCFYKMEQNTSSCTVFNWPFFFFFFLRMPGLRANAVYFTHLNIWALCLDLNLY